MHLLRQRSEATAAKEPRPDRGAAEVPRPMCDRGTGTAHFSGAHVGPTTVNLLDMGTEWKASVDTENVYEGRDRATGEVKWDRDRRSVDLVFGSNSQLRTIADVFACDDSKEKFA